MRRRPSSIIVAAGFLLALAGGGGALFSRAAAPPARISPSLSTPPAGDAAARTVRRGDRNLPNFAVVAPGIYRGAAPTAEGLSRLKRMGVRTIIDLRIERRGQKEEAARAGVLGLTRLRLPMGREAPTKKQVATFLETLDNPARRPVFVHCQYGADRTGAMIGIWRVTRQGWNWERTWAEMRRYGFKPWLREMKASVSSRIRK